jgi:hypothetical protein
MATPPKETFNLERRGSFLGKELLVSCGGIGDTFDQIGKQYIPISLILRLLCSVHLLIVQFSIAECMADMFSMHSPGPRALASPIIRPASRTRTSTSPIPPGYPGSAQLPTPLLTPVPYENVPNGAVQIQNHTPSILPLPLTSPATSTGSIPDMDVIKSLVGRNVINVGMFTRFQLHAIFNLAQAFRVAVQKERALDHVLRVSCTYLDPFQKQRSKITKF